jgi:hypothetical protein
VAELQYSFLCLGFDETKGPPTFQNVLHELPLPEFPYAFPEQSGLFLVNGWNYLEQPEPIRIVIAMSGQRPVADYRFILKPESGKTFQLSLLFLEGLTFPVPGSYEVSIILGEELYSQYPLEVIEAPLEP